MRKAKQDNFFIIHFQPLELYPPVINLLNFLRTNATGKIGVISTGNGKENILRSYRSKTNNIKIRRTAAVIPGSFFRVFNYSFFYLYSLYLLFKNKPAGVLYFETLSSWPALMYKKLRGDKVKLLVHYHEYTSPGDYKKNMRLVKWMHGIERGMYETSYEWISHTNELRLEKFKLDHSLQNVDPAVFHTMPNFPSKFWAKEKTKFREGIKTRLVYVGALGYDNMYLQETIDWVLLNKEFFSLDFYANIIDTNSKNLLNSVQDNCISYFGGCNYEDLPGILKNYDVGLVMYKPFNYNTVNAISNKVFEYIACGLDVWFSKDMQYTFSFIREDTYPKILPVDFSRLNTFDYKTALSRDGLQYQPSGYYYENVYGEIHKNMSGVT